MRKQATKRAIGVAALAAVVALAGYGRRAAGARDTERTQTLANLQTAYDGESNAHARYLAFAQKAQQDGYGEVASLFRAAARAEEVHAANHARVIRELGAEPKAQIKAPEVRETAKNVQAAIDGESYERDTMYPNFVKQARAAGLRDAVETFTQARTAEAEHARLYQDTLVNLEQRRGPERSYYVCTVCGYTTTNLDFTRCPSCFSPKEKYVRVS